MQEALKYKKKAVMEFCSSKGCCCLPPFCFATGLCWPHCTLRVQKPTQPTQTSLRNVAFIAHCISHVTCEPILALAPGKGQDSGNSWSHGTCPDILFGLPGKDRAS